MKDAMEKKDDKIALLMVSTKQIRMIGELSFIGKVKFVFGW